MNRVLARELRIAFSRKAQPVWFRVTKWVIAIAVVTYFWRAPHLWWWIAGSFVLALALHLVWRAKTKVWTQPWGGWHDLDAARDPSSDRPNVR